MIIADTGATAAGEGAPEVHPKDVLHPVTIPGIIPRGVRGKNRRV
jgi:hypothetical protein